MKQVQSKKSSKMRKTVSILSSAALASGIVAPFVAPIDVSANSNNLVDRILYVDDDYTSDPTATVAASNLIIHEKNVEFTTGDTFRLTMPSGVKWLTEQYEPETEFPGTNGVSFMITHSSDRYIELEISGDWGNGKESVSIPLYFEVDGAEGELKVAVESRDSTITSGQYTFALVSDKKTETTITGKSKGYDSIKLKTIRIDEMAVGAMEAGKTIEFTLSSKYKWGGNGEVKYLGAFANTPTGTAIVKGQKIIIKVPAATDHRELGSILVEGLTIKIDDDAPFESIEMDISGEATAETLVVGNRIDYTSKLTAEEPPTLIAGRNNSDLDDLETAELTISESLANTWATGRSFTIELPTWTKIVGYEITEVSGFDKDEISQDLNEEIKGNDNEIELTMLAGRKKRKLAIKFYVSMKADAEGDLTASISGAGIEADPVVIAKVIPPITAEMKKADVRTGIKNQALEDIFISESIKGALMEGEKVHLKFNEHAKFSEKPTVEVIEGDLEIDESSIDVENGVLSFYIDSESRKPSKIKISALKIDLDRTVPQGDFEVEIGGTALVQNEDFQNGIAFDGSKEIGDKTYTAFDISSSAIDVGEFNHTYVEKKAIATVVTPAEGNQIANEVIFKIGATTYKKGDSEHTMDIAPFIEANRTYLPIRYVSEALDVHSEKILWNNELQQVTIIKNDQIVQLFIGSNLLKLNGVDINMDVEAKTVNGRTVLPLRSVVQAFGAQVEWNEEDETITIQ